MACSTLPTLRLVGLVQLAALESWLPVGGCNVLRAQVLEESRHGNESRFLLVGTASTSTASRVATMSCRWTCMCGSCVERH